MAQAIDIAQVPQSPSILDRLGIPRALAFGFLGVLLFMIGDGVEAGYLSPYLIGRGFSIGSVALMITIYGFVVAFASWCSGALSDLWGPRQVMLIGAVVWVVFEIIFLLYGATLAGYVPRSALMPSLAPENKGAAMSLLNLGAGASAWVGPAIVGLFIGPLGVVGVMWIYAVLYVISAILALFLTLPADVEEEIVRDPARSGFRAAAFSAGGTLLGHPPSVPVQLTGDNSIRLITFDLGGTIYDDNCYAQALLRAMRELKPEVLEDEFWQVYDTQLERSSGSLRSELSKRFDVNREQLNELTRKYWEYPSSSLYPDVLPTLTTLSSRYQLGIVADAPASAMEALCRDGLDKLCTVIAISDIVGLEKPDTRFYQYALDKVGVHADRAVHVGNRLDLDIRPRGGSECARYGCHVAKFRHLRHPCNLLSPMRLCLRWSACLLPSPG